MRTFNLHTQSPIMKTHEKIKALQGWPAHIMTIDERRESERRIERALADAHEARMARLRKMGIAAV